MQHDQRHQHNSTYLCQHPGRWCWWGRARHWHQHCSFRYNTTYLCQPPERWYWWGEDRALRSCSPWCNTYLCQHPERWYWWWGDRRWDARVLDATTSTCANILRGGVGDEETGIEILSSWCNTYLCQHPERWYWWWGDRRWDAWVPDATTSTCANILRGGVGDEETGTEILEFLMQHLPVPTSWKVVLVIKRQALRSWCSWCNTYLCQHPERWCWWQGDRRWDPGVPGEAAAAWCWLSSQCC